MKIETAITVYEVSGEKQKEWTAMFIRNHWCNRRLVVIVDSDGKEWAVDARDLRKAIDNATDW